MKIITKDPDALLDYVWDWTDWLEDDTIQAYSFPDLPSDFTNEDDSEVNGIVTLWLSGGVDQKAYVVTCRIQTVGGRADDRSMIFKLVHR